MDLHPSRERLAKCYGDWVRHLARHLGHEAAARAAKDTAPDAINRHRDDGHVAVANDALEAALEGPEHARPCDLALWEDAHDLAFIEKLAGVT